MKKNAFLFVLTLCLIGCEKVAEQNFTPMLKRLAPSNVESGIIIDPQIDLEALSSTEEVAFLAASTMGLNEANATVTWISSQEFYIGYERILQVTATETELEAFYEENHVVPSQALCVVNFNNDTAFAIINPDTRVGNHQQFIKGSYGRTFDPNLLKLTNLTDGINITPTIIDDIISSAYTGPYPSIVKDDLKRLTKCDDIISPTIIPDVIIQCTPLYHQYDTISFYDHGALIDVLDDCDSIESSIARAFGKWLVQLPPFTPLDPIYNGGIGSRSAPPMDELIEDDRIPDSPEEFLRENYCQILPYIESYVCEGSWIMTYEQAADFLDEHGIVVTTYQGDNNTVVRQAMQNNQIPLLYKDNEWEIIYKCRKEVWNCSGRIDTNYYFSIDKCQPNSIADIDGEIDNSYTIVIIEY